MAQGSFDAKDKFSCASFGGAMTELVLTIVEPQRDHREWSEEEKRWFEAQFPLGCSAKSFRGPNAKRLPRSPPESHGESGESREASRSRTPPEKFVVKYFTSERVPPPSRPQHPWSWALSSSSDVLSSAPTMADGILGPPLLWNDFLEPTICVETFHHRTQTITLTPLETGKCAYIGCNIVAMRSEWDCPSYWRCVGWRGQPMPFGYDTRQVYVPESQGYYKFCYLCWEHRTNESWRPSILGHIRDVWLTEDWEVDYKWLAQQQRFHNGARLPDRGHGAMVERRPDGRGAGERIPLW